MSTAIAVPQNSGISADIERALIGGDLSKLNSDQRLSYYKAVCASLGLNPLTKPFDYITLNSKLTLYAKRDCTDQLRKLNGVSINNLKAEQIGELFVVTATAVDHDGRNDSSTGAVSTANLKGEALANAMMKAETKAKRRVTLSLCGLGLLDETEVESITYSEPPVPPSGPQAALQTHSAPVAHHAVAAHAPFRYNKPNLTCQPFSVQRRTAKDGKEFMALKLNGKLEGLDMAFCWHVSLFDALELTKDEQCQFEVAIDGKYLNIVDVLAVGEQEFRDGKPYRDLEAELVITDDDIPF